MISLLHVADILVLFHSLRTYGKLWTVLFFALAYSAGFAAEYAGVSCGWIFGRFHYPGDRILLFGTVPVLNPLGWWMVIYCAYHVTNIILGDRRRRDGEKPGYLTGALLPALLDGLAAMNLDMLLDPTLTSPERKRWVWDTAGAYFGIPLQNFLGWFLVCFFVTLLVRAVETAWGRAPVSGDRLSDYFPLGVYTAILIFFAFLACRDGYPQYALIGVACMAPFILFGVLRGLVTFSCKSSHRAQNGEVSGEHGRST